MFKNSCYLLILFFAIMMNFIALNNIFAEKAKTKSPTDVLAEVNGKQITRADFEKDLDIFLYNLDNATKKYFTEVKNKKARFISFVESHVLEAKAKKDGLDKTSEFQNLYKDELKRALVLAFMKNIEENINVDDSEIKNYYEKNKERFENKNMYRLFVGFAKSFDETNKIIKAFNSQKNLVKLEKGNHFYGYTTADYLIPQISNKLNNLKVNDVSAPIEIANAYPNVFSNVSVASIGENSGNGNVAFNEGIIKIIQERAKGMKDSLYAVIKYTNVKKVDYPLLKKQIKKEIIENKKAEQYRKILEIIKQEVSFETFKTPLEMLSSKVAAISDEQSNEVVLKYGRSTHTLKGFMMFLQKKSFETLCKAVGKDKFDMLFDEFCVKQLSEPYVEKNLDKLEKQFPEIAEITSRNILATMVINKNSKNIDVNVQDKQIDEKFNENVASIANENLIEKLDSNRLAAVTKPTETKLTEEQIQERYNVKPGVKYIPKIEVKSETKTENNENKEKISVYKDASKEIISLLKEQIKQEILSNRYEENSNNLINNLKTEFNVKIYDDRI